MSFPKGTGNLFSWQNAYYGVYGSEYFDTQMRYVNIHSIEMLKKKMRK